jgi:hypothetical protein
MTPEVAVPVLGLLVGALAIVMGGVVVARISQGPIGQAIARRLQGRHAEGDPELRNEVFELRETVAQLEHRLLEAEERLDFSERLLTKSRTAPEAADLPNAGR